MIINFEYNDVKSSKRLEDLVSEKLEFLHKKFNMILRADVFFKLENTTSNETGKICSIRLSVPGPRLFAESSNENFVNSISKTIDELDKQLTTKKGKLINY